MEISGLPVHPLIVHAVVTLTPLAGFLAVVYAVVPRWRWLVRWPLVLAAVVGAVVTYVAKISGEDLKETLQVRGDLIETHEMWADRLQIVMIVLAVLAIVAAFVLPRVSPLAARAGDAAAGAARSTALAVPLSVLLVVAGLITMFVVFKTGDAGARMVWERG